MKKKLISLIFALTLISCLLLTPAAAMADKEKEINVENIYQIVWTENPNITVLGNSIYTIGLSGGIESGMAYTNAVQIATIKANQKKIAFAAEQTLLSYYTLENTLEELLANDRELSRTLKLSKVMLDQGMMSQLEYDTALLGQKQLKANIETLKQNIIQLKGNLNMMVNNNYDDKLVIGDFTPLDQSLIDGLDKETLYQSAINKSYDLEAARQKADGAMTANDIADGTELTETALNSAHIEYVNAQKTLDMTFSSMWDDLMIKRDAQKLAVSNYEFKKKEYEIDKTKYELGMLSKNDFDSKTTQFELEELKVENAEIELYAAYKKFNALCQGISLAASVA